VAALNAAVVAASSVTGADAAASSQQQQQGTPSGLDRASLRLAALALGGYSAGREAAWRMTCIELGVPSPEHTSVCGSKLWNNDCYLPYVLSDRR
jgi:hypothetical protein